MKNKEKQLITNLDWHDDYANEEFYDALEKDQNLLRQLLDIKYPNKFVKTNFEKLCDESNKAGFKHSNDKFYEAFYKDNQLLRKILKPILKESTKKATKK